MKHYRTRIIGGVIDYSSRVGREQGVAMEMTPGFPSFNLLDPAGFTLQRFTGKLSSSSFFWIRTGDVPRWQGTAERYGERFGARWRRFGPLEIAIDGVVAVIFHRVGLKQPSFWRIAEQTAPAPRSPFPYPYPYPYLYQCNIVLELIGSEEVQAIIGTITPQEAMIVSEIRNCPFSSKWLGSEIDDHTAFPPQSSVSEQDDTIRRWLRKRRSKSNRVFILAQSSIEFAISLFEKAKQIGMMEKGYVWIVSDEIASLLDSVDISALYNMQGVLGCGINFADSTESFRRFKTKFRKSYRTRYAEEEEEYSSQVFMPCELMMQLGQLQKPCTKHRPMPHPKNYLNNYYQARFYWPGGLQTVPKGWTSFGKDKDFQLKCSKPFLNAFLITYKLVPFYGSYDDMVEVVYSKRLDAAVGDTEIMSYRYQYAEFSQPYLESGLIMVASCLTSMLTISQLQPSVPDIDTLLRTNATVGCNGNSFIVRGNPQSVENGEMPRLEEYLLNSYNIYSSSTAISGGSSSGLGPRPFAGLFFVSGGISVFAFVVASVRLGIWRTETRTSLDASAPELNPQMSPGVAHQEQNPRMDSLVTESATFTKWTDGKHRLYLKSMETSFVNQFYDSVNLLGSNTQKEKLPRPESSRQKHCTSSGQFFEMAAGRRSISKDLEFNFRKQMTLILLWQALGSSTLDLDLSQVF
ncbi:hypothetical protein F3Y22_tig00110163pilonHSYRG00036 [Hibiscus syriacus]|uniref:Receptor ligand binding region domain-containing protein n=1 Tax=Hibiscus syriacus TaxID=106335 RepID=A0A6A3BEI9_HIBSY|nr:hypothetical protein F3Y22_tig00110163pilonHSYRG00036 [Hibiscus syriacus]